MKALRVVGYLWSAPYGLLGIVAGLSFWALGWAAVITWRAGALELVCRGPFARWMGRDRGGARWLAFTLGWTVFYWAEPDPKLRRHEHRHVTQALLFGPFYPVLYLALLIARGYHDHPFERDARRIAGTPSEE